jgi:hypothetical protein
MSVSEGKPEGEEGIERIAGMERNVVCQGRAGWQESPVRSLVLEDSKCRDRTVEDQVCGRQVRVGGRH